MTSLAALIVDARDQAPTFAHGCPREIASGLTRLRPGAHVALACTPIACATWSLLLRQYRLEIRDVLVWAHAQRPAMVIIARQGLEGGLADTVHRHGCGGLHVAAVQQPSASAGRALARFPTNVVLQHEASCTSTRCQRDCAVHQVDARSGNRPGGNVPACGASARKATDFRGRKPAAAPVSFDDGGGASRFFTILDAGDQHMWMYLQHLLVPKGAPFATAGLAMS